MGESSYAHRHVCQSGLVHGQDGIYPGIQACGTTAATGRVLVLEWATGRTQRFSLNILFFSLFCVFRFLRL